MATMRAISSSMNNTTTSLIFKHPSSFWISKRSRHCSLTSEPTVCDRVFSCRAIHRLEDVHAKEHGHPETLDCRVFLQDTSGKKISPWHDIPLHLGDGIFNFVVEIPKDSSAKMEIVYSYPAGYEEGKTSLLPPPPATISIGIMVCCHRHGKTHRIPIAK